MIFRQLFDQTSCTYTYLVASHKQKEALIIDPVIEHVDQYLKLLSELDLKLRFAIDTHVHADHITGLSELREATECATVMGEMAHLECTSINLRDGEQLELGEIVIQALYTPGHTSDSYCYFLLPDRIFTGDTLLIRGTGRTDFQNGDPNAQYDSLFNKLLLLPDNTYIFPAHDYNGMTVSTIGEERIHNPRLQVNTKEEYVQMMNGLELEPPELMNIAVPANRHCGRRS